MTPQELKNSILQLAIQGKLVEQRPEEGTGEELYQQIQEEKKKLIAEGKIKKEKPLPEITEEEIPFEIPESWKWVRLKDIVAALGDGIHGTPMFDDFGRYYFINGNNLAKGKIEIKADTKKVSVEEFEKYKKPLDDNTILISINGTIGNYAFYNNEPVILGKSACYFSVLGGIEKRYICYLLNTEFFLKYAIKEATQTTIKNVSLKAMRMFMIPLPPLAEQKRIVAKIEELLPYIDRYEQAWSKLEEFNKRFPGDMQKSILQMAIQGKLVEQRPEEGTGEEVVKKIYADRHNQVKTKTIKKEKELPIVQNDDYLFDIPENWVWERIGNVGSWASGATPSRTNSEYYNGDIPWLKTGDLNDGDVIEVPEYITEIALEKTSVRLNPIGSVLMAMYGATIGKLGILQIEATTNQACCACIPFDGMYNKYLFYYLMASRKTLDRKSVV